MRVWGARHTVLPPSLSHYATASQIFRPGEGDKFPLHRRGHTCGASWGPHRTWASCSDAISQSWSLSNQWPMQRAPTFTPSMPTKRARVDTRRPPLKGRPGNSTSQWIVRGRAALRTSPPRCSIHLRLRRRLGQPEHGPVTSGKLAASGIVFHCPSYHE